MIAVQAAARFGILREAGEQVVHEDLDEMWGALETVRAEEILGQWRGSFDTGHPVQRLLAGSGWYGKRFNAHTVMGVMDGRATWVLSEGGHFWFGLERVR